MRRGNFLRDKFRLPGHSGRRRRHRTPAAGTWPGARRRARKAGLVVLNTCTVTAAADQDARAAIRRIHRKNPDAQIVVTGCYAQRAPEEIAALPGVTQVIGNSHKHLLAELAGVGRRTSDIRLRPLDLECPTDSKTFVPITQLTSDVRGPKSEVRGPTSDQSDRRFRHLRPYGTPGRAGLRRSQRAHPSQPEGAGRLRQPMFILRNSLRPRTEPIADRSPKSFAKSKRWSPLAIARW